MTTTLTSKKSSRDLDRETLRYLARTNLYRLAKDILGYRDMTDTFHRPLLLWSQTQPIRKKLHMVARGNFKTSGLTVAKNIQRLLIDPNVRILLASNKAQNAEAMLAEIKGHLANPFLISLFPEILVTDPERRADRWTHSAITVKRTRNAKEATIETNGVEGELTSKHYEVGCYDDLVGLENSQSRAERQKVITWIQAAQSLVDQPTRDLAFQDWSGTPWDYDDAYAWMLAKRAKGEWAMGVYVMPCWVADADGTAEAAAHRQAQEAEEKAGKLRATPEEIEAARRLRSVADGGFGEVPGYGLMRSTFPERFTIPTLRALRKEIGATRFSAQYLLKPTDSETAVFKRLDPNPAQPDGIPATRPRAMQPALDDLWLALTIDPAISKKGWADYSALTVCGWDHANNQHVLWLRWGKWSETELIAETYLAYNHFASRGHAPSVVAIEPIGFQQLYRHLFVSEGEKRGQFLPVTKLERDKGTEKKNSRIAVLEPSWNAGELILYDDLDALDDLLDMASKFRLDTELTRDDLLDVLADNHQVRIRPHAPDPVGTALAHLTPEEQDRARFERAAQERRAAEGVAPLDRASLRMSFAIEKRHREFEEQRQLVVSGYGEEDGGW